MVAGDGAVRGAVLRLLARACSAARRRFAPGCGNIVAEVRFLCAAAHPGAEGARCGSITRRSAQGGAPAGAAGGLGAVDGRQRMAAPVTGYGVQAAIGGLWPP